MHSRPWRTISSSIVSVLFVGLPYWSARSACLTPTYPYLQQVTKPVTVMSVVIPYINSFCYRMGKFHLDLLSVTSDWVRIGLTDAAFKNTIYLAACRHLWKTQRKENFHELSMQFKIACMRELNYEITKAVPLNDTIIAKTVMLSWDEVRAFSLIFLPTVDNTNKTSDYTRRHKRSKRTHERRTQDA